MSDYFRLPDLKSWQKLQHEDNGVEIKRECSFDSPTIYPGNKVTVRFTHPSLVNMEHNNKTGIVEYIFSYSGNPGVSCARVIFDDGSTTKLATMWLVLEDV